jgi:hypothetical protein
MIINKYFGDSILLHVDLMNIYNFFVVYVSL